MTELELILEQHHTWKDANCLKKLITIKLLVFFSLYVEKYKEMVYTKYEIIFIFNEDSNMIKLVLVRHGQSEWK